jgi:hypothetical protein
MSFISQVLLVLARHSPGAVGTDSARIADCPRGTLARTLEIVLERGFWHGGILRPNAPKSKKEGVAPGGQPLVN